MNASYNPGYFIFSIVVKEGFLKYCCKIHSPDCIGLYFGRQLPSWSREDYSDYNYCSYY